MDELESQLEVYRYDGEQFTFLAGPLPEDRDANWHDEVAGIARGKDGRLWFATWESVIGCDGESLTIIDNQSAGLNEATGFLHVKCAVEDSKAIYRDERGDGVFKFNGKSFDRVR